MKKNPALNWTQRNCFCMTVCIYGFKHKIEAIIFAKKREIKIVIDKVLAIVASHCLLKKSHDCELKR